MTSQQSYESGNRPTGEEILKHETPAKVCELPSGKLVTVKYLPFLMVTEIYEDIAATGTDDKEHIFTEKVVKWLLRENDQNDYGVFLDADRKRLVEISVEEWGCQDEYDSLEEIKNPEKRFYLAVGQKEEEFARVVSESFKQITANLADTFLPLKAVQDNLASMIGKGLLNQLGGTAQLNETFAKINQRAIDQIIEINKLSPPIIDMAGLVPDLRRVIASPIDKAFLDNVEGTISSYQTLMKDILPIARFVALPESVRYYPTVEMHNTSIVTGSLISNDPQKVLDEEIITPDDNILLVWLASLDQSFPAMLQGAKETIFSRNPDHCRHFASSHRELSTHILHLLAPDKDVEKWTKDPKAFVNGRPTRKTRLRFIARNHDNEKFVNFVVNDFENQMDLLNADEHRKVQNYANEELNLLHKRFLSMLGFLMQIVNSHSS